MRKTIKDRIPPPKHIVTLMFEGGNKDKPLVDTGRLWQSIKGTTESWHRGFAGVLSTAKANTRTSRKGIQRVTNLGMILHDGATIRVTPKMRAMFTALMRVTVFGKKRKTLRGRALEIHKKIPSGAKVYALSPSTTAIKIPARPFVTPTARNQTIRHKCYRNWMNAVMIALLSTSRRAKIRQYIGPLKEAPGGF
jgi:hypothetical protein